MHLLSRQRIKHDFSSVDVLVVSVVVSFLVYVLVDFHVEDLVSVNLHFSALGLG